MLIIFSIILVICLHNDGVGGVGGVVSGTPSSCTEQDEVGGNNANAAWVPRFGFSFNSGICDCDKMRLRSGYNSGI